MKTRGLLTLTLLAVALLPRPGTVSAAPAIDGLWDAVIVANGIEIPFRFEKIAVKGGDAQGYFFEGDRKVGSTAGTFADGALKLEYDFLNTTLEAALKGDELIGSYHNNRAGARTRSCGCAGSPRPTIAEDNTPSLAGTWEMRRNADEIKAPRDTRTWQALSAPVRRRGLRHDPPRGWRHRHADRPLHDGKLMLSHFAGERPTLFEATLNPDGTLAITLNGQRPLPCRAQHRSPAQGHPRSARSVTLHQCQGSHRALSFQGCPSTARSFPTPTRLQGKVVILAIGGSWCPNCHDEAPFLIELYNKFHARGLEIVGLIFENSEDPAVAQPRMQSFIRRYGIQYPMLIAGTTQPSPTSKTIAEALPQLVNFGAYPTTIVLGRDGRVRNVHAGFPSAATGAEHVRHKQEVRELIERLLAEPS